MKRIFLTTQFRKDFKRCKKQNRPLADLQKAIDLLISGEDLPAAYKYHPLKGGWSDFRDLHLAPDWLLIYRNDEDSVTLARTGSHSELFE